MDGEEENGRYIGAWILPLLCAGGEYSWPAALCLGGAAWLLTRLTPAGEPGKWGGILHAAWDGWILSGVLNWGSRGDRWIAWILLALAVCLGWRQRDGRICRLLGTAAAVLAMIPLLTAVRQVRPENLLPQWQMKSGLPVSLILMTCSREKKDNWNRLLPVLVGSLLTVGVFGGLWKKITYPISELSESVGRMGGIMAFALYLGIGAAGGEILRAPMEKRVWLKAGTAGLGLLLAGARNPLFEIGVSLAIYALLPWIKAIKRKPKKVENSA